MDDHSADALLEQADACHDDDPHAAATLLRALPLAELSADKRPRLAVLLNHVFGELLGQWPEAHRRQTELLAAAAPTPGPVLLRHAAVGARLADAPDYPARLAEFADAGGAPLPRADEVIAAAAVSLQLSRLSLEGGARHALAALHALKAPWWQSAGPLDATAAVACNNIGSHFVDRPIPELALPAVREVIADAARLAQVFWQRAGGWVQQERAWYLRALASQALHEPEQALRHAQEGLALIDAHDRAHEQPVDRAFLLLELALAYRRLGREQAANDTQAMAAALINEVDEPGLREWFDERVARNAALAQVTR